jgi:hypothetical protein
MKRPTGIDVGGYGIQAGFHVIAGVYNVQWNNKRDSLTGPRLSPIHLPGATTVA